MGESKKFLLTDVASHNTRNDLSIIIHEKVYEVSSFVSEHPGGEEVLVDLAGQDATEAFEDVGHSDEAREILEGMIVGTVKRLPSDPAPKIHSIGNSTPPGTSFGSTLSSVPYGMIVVGATVLYGIYQYVQQNPALVEAAP